MSENKQNGGRKETGANPHVVDAVVEVLETPFGTMITVGVMCPGAKVENDKAEANCEQLEQLHSLIERMAAADEKKPRGYARLLDEVYEFMNGIEDPNAKKVQQLIDDEVSKGAIILAMQDVEGRMREAVKAQQTSEARHSSGGPERIPTEVLAILAAILEGGF